MLLQHTEPGKIEGGQEFERSVQILADAQRRVFTHPLIKGGIGMEKRLYKSDVNKTFLGVCGGIGEYFNIDPTLIRLAWIIFCFAGGSGILAYIIAAVVIPSRG